ncbi:pilin protein [Stenotrophomonas sp. SPM]|uniref:CfaE/CblD family pilus tip adhesin n=1 Tax=unclassified Stenotrophomonas TaxID=196198 RepID=UPI000DE743FB|nr:pilin protein [Stenotrophomonas sp. SPM]
MVVCVLAVLAPQAMAQQPPETDPTPIVQKVTLEWDRSSMPGDLEIWPDRTVLGFSRDVTRKLGQIHLTCRSSVDPSQGSCSTSGDENLSFRPSEIVLRMVEQRSGLPTDVRLKGWLRRIVSGRACSGDFWTPHVYPLNSAAWDQCSIDTPLGTGVALVLPQSELRNLVAGRWRGELKLDVRVDPAQAAMLTNTVTFDFTITDHNAVSIYFPLFDQVTPHVGLNLQYDPIAQTVSGSTKVDMCLYDGLGSQSQYLGITVHDSGARLPGPSGYSVWHTDGGSDATQRVDYTVTLDHSGTAIPLRNGVEQLLHGIDTAKLRLVMLPGMTQPVFCVPTPITLDTPRVSVSTKRPGHYSGDLKVELRVPTATP